MRRYPLALLRWLERMLGRAFPAEWNPLYSLGALCFYLFWIDAVTGLYLFVFFETSIEGAYASVESITHVQWYLGGIMRSVHRYASAALVVVVTLHLVKEWVLGRFRGGRWFTWISGVPLLWLMFAAGIGGYWLVWDQRAQYIAITTANLFDWLPVTIDPMAFGFLTPEALSDRFFTLMIFLHIGIPLALLLGMFIHIKRVGGARTNPVIGLGTGMLAALVLLSLVKPALSLPPADLTRSIGAVGIDWFYLNFYPLIDRLGPGPVWLMLGVVTVGLSLLPWLPRQAGKKLEIARVDPEFCNGCSWCAADCPYEAIRMVEHESKPGHRQAMVLEDCCVGCSICAGACPSATPFRTVDQLISGIDLPSKSIRSLFEVTSERVAALAGERRVVLFGCDHGPEIDGFADRATAVIKLPCVGQLPPSFLDHLCRRQGVNAVVVSGCGDGDCYHRSGNRWLEERISARRHPHVRHGDVRDRITTVWSAAGGEARIEAALRAARTRVDGGASPDCEGD